MVVVVAAQNKPPPHLVPQALMSTIHFAFGVVGIIRFWHEDKHRATVPHNHQPKEQIFHTKEHHTGDATNEHVVSKAVVLGAVRFAFLALVVFQFIVRTRAAHLLIEAQDKVQAGSLWMQHVVNIIVSSVSLLALVLLCCMYVLAHKARVVWRPTEHMLSTGVFRPLHGHHLHQQAALSHVLRAPQHHI